MHDFFFFILVQYISGRPSPDWLSSVLSFVFFQFLVSSSFLDDIDDMTYVSLISSIAIGVENSEESLWKGGGWFV